MCDPVIPPFFVAILKKMLDNTVRNRNYKKREVKNGSKNRGR